MRRAVAPAEISPWPAPACDRDRGGTGASSNTRHEDGSDSGWEWQTAAGLAEQRLSQQEINLILGLEPHARLPVWTVQRP